MSGGQEGHFPDGASELLEDVVQGAYEQLVIHNRLVGSLKAHVGKDFILQNENMGKVVAVEEKGLFAVAISTVKPLALASIKVELKIGDELIGEYPKT